MIIHPVKARKRGGWCKYKGNQELIDKAASKNRYRDKKKDMELYKLVLEIWEHFGTDLMMEQVYHLFTSQKSESLHQQITRVAPKDKHFSGTMALSDRVSLVVITDSVGYESGMLLVFEELGITLPDVTIQYLRQRNEKREYDKVYRNRPDRKNLRYSIKKENIRKELQRKADEAATGLGYGPSMYTEEILETEERLMGDEETGQTKNATENIENCPRMDVEAVSTTVDVNLKKPKIPRSQQKCSDCPIWAQNDEERFVQRTS